MTTNSENSDKQLAQKELARARKTWEAAALAVFLTLGLVLFVSNREWAAPGREALILVSVMFALLAVSFCFVAILARWESTFPLFEVGTICVLVSLLYFFVPLVNYLFGGMRFTLFSDNRLIGYDPSPADIARVALRSVTYLLSLCVAYLAVRRRTQIVPAFVELPRAGRTTTILFLFVALGGLILAIEAIYGVSFNPPYAETRAGIGLTSQLLPYYLQQIMHNVRGMYFVTKLAMLMLFVLNWRRLPVRVLGCLWLLSEVALPVVRQGARTDGALLILGAILLYHRVVKRLTLWRTCVGGVVLLGGLILAGVMRDVQGGLGAVASTGISFLSVNNEFQSVFATGYDLYERSWRKELPGIPWALYANDILALIPSQALPFVKVDPSQWYLELLGLQDAQIGLMFGVLSQSALGFDWVELAARGALLGSILGLVHRCYVKRARYFSWTLAYLFLCVWIYYTVRSTTFAPVYFVVYRLLPVMLLVEIGGMIMAGAVGNDRVRRARANV